MVSPVGWRRSRKSVILTSLFTIAVVIMAGFATTAGAAALKQSDAPVGATGIGVNAPPNGTTSAPNGLWDANNYSIPHHAASCPQPPVSTQERLALVNSPTLLDYYGIPKPGSVDGGAAKWQTLVAGMTHRICDYSTPIEYGKGIMNITWDGTWSGFGNQALGNTQHYASEMNISTSDIAQTYTHSAVSMWIGVGGANGGALSQTGLEEESSNNNITRYVFFESVSCGVNPFAQIAFYINVGDWMFFKTDASGNDLMDDQTTGAYESISGWGCGSRDSSEFLAERVNGAWLARFGTVTFREIYWEDVGGAWHSNLNDNGLEYQWLLTADGHRDTNYMITFPSWPTSDPSGGMQYESDWQRYY